MMILKDYDDMNGDLIDTEKVYFHENENVSDIHIVQIDNDYYALPDGLDEELLREVCNELTPQK